MSDFFQNGQITTFHILGDKGRDKIRKELIEFSKTRKISLIIPVLYSDYIRPAMKNILEILKSVEYLNQIILSLGRASYEEFQMVKDEIKDFPYKITVLWMDNPELRKLLNFLEENHLNLGEDGKGKSCWTSFGLVLAQKDSEVVALHDSDIVTYSEELLSRLLYPIVNPHMPYDFSKGFYARFSTKMHGRVTRLFIIPLLEAISKVFGEHPLINYLKSFRYHLAGEFALKTSLTRIIRFPGDWGLEVSTLYEIYRNTALKRVCQVELTHRYDHKHQVVSKDDATKGLHKMAIDIAINIFKNLAAEGIIISEGGLKTLQKNYLKIAEDIISNYHADAMMNGLEFIRHEEETTVETFYRALTHSSEQYLKDPLSYMMLPNWNRITSAYPEFLGKLLKIVDKDNE